MWSATSLGTLDGSGWEQSLGQKANIVVPEVGYTCTTGRGRVIDFGVISECVQPFWQGITPEYNSPCKSHVVIFLQFTSHTGPREAGLFPQDLRFPENCRGGGASEKAYEVKDQS